MESDRSMNGKIEKLIKNRKKAKKYINAIFIKYIFMFINYESCHVGPPRGMSHGGES